MKAKLIGLILCLTYGMIQSQEINCAATQTEFAKLVELQNYKDANAKLNLLLSKCATSDENIYLLGAKVIQNKIDVATNDDKEKAAKEMIALYDKHDKNFPNNTSNNLINKAMLFYDFDLASEAETFQAFDKAFAKDKFQFTNPLALFTYFKMFNEDYRSKEDRNLDQMLTKYSQVLSVIEKNKSISPDKEIEFNNVKIGLNSIVKNNLTIEDITEYAERNLPKNKSNIEWLDATVDLMLEKCADKPVFGTIAGYLHALKPSSKSAFALGSFHLKNNDREKAVQYLKLAAELAPEKAEKARIYSANALVLFGFDKKSAKESILLAIQNDEKNGEHFIFLSNLYASSSDECGKSPIEKKAIYQLATTAAQKASDIQPSLIETSKSLIESYKKNALTDKEKEQIKKSENKVTIDCWINETVQF
jgi:tetratricopeptide (TPR) repeat protein